MTKEFGEKQGDLFPKLLQRESLHAEQDRAKKRLQDLRALPRRIEGYWQGFYQAKLADWTLEAELKEQYGFDYQFCEDGGLVLQFYYPTPSEIGLSESDYLAFEQGLIEILDPKTKSEISDIDFTAFLRWTLEGYWHSDNFTESKVERIEGLIQDSSEVNDPSNELNILSTNNWEVDLDGSESNPAVRLRARLNTVSKIFVIDHFDCGVEEELFDLDDFKWWARADGEGIWGCYQSLFGSKEPIQEDSFWRVLTKWIRIIPS